MRRPADTPPPGASLEVDGSTERRDEESPRRARAAATARRLDLATPLARADGSADRPRLAARGRAEPSRSLLRLPTFSAADVR